MASTFTDNFQLEKQGVGDNVDTWGDPTLNSNVIARIDAALGATTAIALVSSPVTLTQAQWRSKCIKLTGTISANIVISLPLSVNSVGSATAVGGEFIIDNQTTGAYTITVKTAATASTGVEVPQGFRSTLYSDTVNVTYSDDQSRSTIQTYAGNPNGSVAGTAGSSTTPASMLYDRSNGILYVCTTTGDATTAVWTAINGPIQEPQGYLTTSSNVNNVVITGDAIGATTLYYTPYNGNSCPLFNGTVFVPFVFTQQSLALTASQAAAGLYDVYGFLDGSTFRIGFGPSWAAGSGGSVTAGSCVRGTGVGGAAIQRQNGLWVNTAVMTMTNGVTTYSVAALRGTVLATVFIDSTQGQVTCHRTYGQSRKWGVWNFYNRMPVFLKAGDPNATWTGVDTSGVWRPANNNSANSFTYLCGLQEEVLYSSLAQIIKLVSTSGIAGIGMGLNSTSSPSGMRLQQTFSMSSATSFQTMQTPILTSAPLLGVNVITALEEGSTGAANTQFFGTENSMVLQGQWRA